MLIWLLNELRSAANEAMREKTVQDTLAQIEQLEEDQDSGVVYEEYAQYAEYGAWVASIPGLIKTNKKLAKKYLRALVECIARKNEITRETPEALIRKIKRCKSLEALEALEAGKNISQPKQETEEGKKYVYRLSVSLEDRITHLAANLADNGGSIRDALAEQRKYLERKKLADKIAWWLTIVLCMLGIGVVCGVVMFMALPAMGIVGTLFASAGIGYVEVPVFYGFIKRSLRNLFVRGVFQAIDNNLLNQLAKEEGKKDRHDYKKEEQEQKLNSGATWWWRRIKYALTSVGGLLTIAATVGFSGVAYTQVLAVLPLIGITAGVGLVIIPWFFAIISLPYFFVMFDNIYRAIKNNIFKQIGEQVKSVYVHDNWSALSGEARAIHILKCFGKSLVVALILGIVVIATVFTAGAWLQGSASFFMSAFNVANSIAEKIGIVIGSIQLATNLGFNLENCFKTVQRFAKIAKGAGNSIRAYVNESIEMVNAEPYLPKKVGIALWRIFRPLVKFGPLILHIIGIGFFTSKGKEAEILQPMLGANETVNTAVAVTTAAVCEGLEDSHTLLHDHNNKAVENDDSHHPAHHQEEAKHCDSHEHADPAADVEWIAGKVYRLFKGDEPAPLEEVEEVVVLIRP